MYVGRIVAVGCTPAGIPAVMYRVSSRSFPNRETVLAPGRVAVVPSAGHEKDVQRNPYIAYNCLRVTANGWVVAANGSHADPAADKLESGMTGRDAVTTALFALDYERDDYRTPRIVAAAPAAGGIGILGIIRADALLVRELQLEPGTARYVCTYERNDLGTACTEREFTAATAAEACEHVLERGAFAELERPITAAAAVGDGGGGWEIATASAPRREQ